MSQFFFEQNDLIQRFCADATLGDVFTQIEGEVKAIKEVICQFKVNGLALNEQDEKRLSSSSLEEIQTLEVYSQEPRAILGDVLVSWSSQIPTMIEQNDRLAEQIRFQGMEGLLKALVELIDQSQLLVDSILSIDTVFSEFPVVQSEAWRSAQQQMAETIGEALQAFQKKDYTWLADILEYNMGHSLQTWMELLGRLKQDVTNTAGPTP